MVETYKTKLGCLKTEATAYNEQYVSDNILTAEAATTGVMGGDSGHGGVTYLELADDGGTDMSIEYDDEADGYMHTAKCERIKLFFGGDSELETFRMSLTFAASVLWGNPKMTLWGFVKMWWHYHKFTRNNSYGA